MMEIKTKQDVLDFTTGCCFFGCGGGGNPTQGIAALNEVLDQGKSIQLTSLEDIRDDDVYASIFLMGSIEEATEETRQKQRRNQVPETPPLTPQEALSRSLQVLEAYTGRHIDGFFAIELGGGNTCIPMAVAMDHERIFLDADAAGRAYPQMTQALPLIMDKPCLPIAIVDCYGVTNILISSINNQMIERNGKMLADSGFGMCAHACYIMTGKELRDALIPGTLSQCLKVGRTIREANENGMDPVTAAAEAAGGTLIAQAKMVSKEASTTDGLYYGTITLEGVGKYAGEIYKLWFENEYMVMWKNDLPYITSPDIIQCVDAKTCRPLTNTVLKPGDDVCIIAVPAREPYTKGKPFSVLNPRYYSFDFDHIPLNELLQ